MNSETRKAKPPSMLINKKCPMCENGELYLDIKKFKHITKNGNKSLEGDWYVYVCNTCDECFTTTESDTISQKNLKQKKL